ncbi:M15 family metallopeptidase [Pseudalkalibacillus sp. Hm43]|uniref:M15 family metallopeptidase n=1 Tax=Pseudalkalibacillus sp. Hm43 TaxID=3450742 RepID=UPI003F42673C
MRLLSVLLISTFIILGGCQNDEAGTDNEPNHEVANGEEQRDKENEDPIKEPAYAKIESSFKDLLMQETNAQQRVKAFSDKESLIQHLEAIVAKDVAEHYVDQYFEEKNDDLYLKKQDAPVWLNTDEEFEEKQQSETTYVVIQTTQNQLRGKYTLKITYQYTEDQWKISAREVEVKQEEQTEQEEQHKEEKHSTEEKQSTDDSDTNKEEKQQTEQQNEDKNTSEENQASKDPEKHKDPEPTESSPVIVDKPSSILAVVNKKRHLPDSYVPNDLVETPVPFPFEEDLPKKLLRSEAATALDQMFEDANSQGLELFAQSGYRSYDRQEAIFASNVDRYGSKEEANKVSAQPGESEHQTGLAMDVTSPAVDYRLIQSFDQTEEGQWVLNHAHEYGFIIRYPKGESDITGYSYEPWHLRYVGKKAAGYIHSKQLTLEEYRGFQ